MFDIIVERLASAGLEIHGIEVFCGGNTVLSHLPGGGSRFPVYSAAKSVTSAAFSLACDDGLLSAETPLSEFIDKRCRDMMSSAFKALPFSSFLTMTAGKYPFRPDGDDWLANIFAHDADHSDNSFNYSNIPAYLVGAAVENAVGEKLIKYLDRRLFDPLGIPEPPYAVSPEGHFYGATGMQLSVHELSLFGQLYLNNGCYQGNRLLSENAVAETVKPRVKTASGDHYGYFFRVADDHFSVVGKWGQRCMIYPQKQLVISYLSHQPDAADKLCAVVTQYAEAIPDIIF